MSISIACARCFYPKRSQVGVLRVSAYRLSMNKYIYMLEHMIEAYKI
jgi:hypothetical protein